MKIETNNKAILADNIRSHNKYIILKIMKWIMKTYETDVCKIKYYLWCIFNALAWSYVQIISCNLWCTWKKYFQQISFQNIHAYLTSFIRATILWMTNPSIVVLFLSRLRCIMLNRFLFWILVLPCINKCVILNIFYTTSSKWSGSQLFKIIISHLPFWVLDFFISSKTGKGSLNEHGSNVSLVQTLIFIALFLPSDENEHLRRSSSSSPICLSKRMRV